MTHGGFEEGRILHQFFETGAVFVDEGKGDGSVSGSRLPGRQPVGVAQKDKSL